MLNLGDVLRHLVSYAPGLSDTNRAEATKIVDDAFPPEDQAAAAAPAKTTAAAPSPAAAEASPAAAAAPPAVDVSRETSDLAPAPAAAAPTDEQIAEALHGLSTQQLEQLLADKQAEQAQG